MISGRLAMQKAQGIGSAQHPLSHRLLGKHFVDEQRRALGHAPGPATGAEPAPLAAEGDQVLGMAGVATHPQKSVLEATALEVSLEFLLHIVRQGPALPGQELDERRVVLRNDALEQRVLGPVARVAPRARRPGARCRRGLTHVPRPCNAVRMYSIPLGRRLCISAAERDRGSRRGRSCRPVSTFTAA
jgi:hypothetical protein